MADEARLVGAFVLPLCVVWVLIPVAIAVAARTDFYDHPAGGYKSHRTPTPYLGGAAVVAGFLAAVMIFGGELSESLPIVACVAALSILGTVDDRVGTRPIHRILAGAVAGAALWSAGVSWGLDSELADLALTVLWTLALTNAFNILDNMDGVVGTLAAVCAVGISASAYLTGDVLLSASALALGGACLAFLRYNLTRPARIFLGDGGSMPIGFAVAALSMSVVPTESFGWPALLGAGMLVGVPILDTLQVIISRTRRGIPLTQPGRESLSYRLQRRFRSVRHIVVVLGALQAASSLLAVVTIELGRGAVIAAGTGSLLVGVILIAILETPAWAPDTSERPEQVRV